VNFFDKNAVYCFSMCFLAKSVFFVRWNISVIFRGDILVTEIFWSFISQLCRKTRHKSVFSVYFQTFGPKCLNILVISKTFQSMTEKAGPSMSYTCFYLIQSFVWLHHKHQDFLKPSLIGSLKFQIGSLVSLEIIIRSLKSEKIGSIEWEKSGPCRSISGT